MDKLNFIEEIKQEWEADGWEWIEDECCITLSKDEDPLDMFKEQTICINKYAKTYEYLNLVYYTTDFIALVRKDHQRLIKTFKALGWKVNNNE